MKTYSRYALWHTNRHGLVFSCVSDTKADLGRAISKALAAWKGLQPKGSRPDPQEFFKTRKPVEISFGELDYEEADHD